MPQRPSLRPPPTLLKLLAACGLAVVLSSASAYASTDEFPGPDPETPEIDCNTYTGGQGSSDTARETTALPVDVARATLVSNRGHLDGIGHRTHGGTALQGFTTGGNPAGYVLSEISVVLEAPSDQTSMEIWTQKGTPLTYRPGKLLYRLISPPPMPTCEPVTFTAPPGTTLAPNTTYYARYVDAGVIAWDYDRQLDSGTATGWSLEDGLMSQSLGANAYTRYRPNGIIAIRGIALLGPPGTVTGLSARAGQGAVTLSWSEPDFDGQTSVIKYQVRHKESSAPVSGYGAWVDVADRDGDGDLSDERVVTVPGLAGNVEYTLQVRAVNGVYAGAPSVATVNTLRLAG